MGATGIIIGRFQSIEITGQLNAVIDNVQKKHDSVAIVLGVHRTGSTRRNPLNVESRKAVIASRFPDIKILLIEDHPSDSEWSSNLDALIEANFKEPNNVLYGSQDGFVNRYDGRFRTVAIGESYSPSEVDPEPQSREFRQGVVFGMQGTFPKVYPTVDIAVFRNERSEILLGMKSSGKKWRFPGGFTDPADNSFETAALRELQEECGALNISGLTYEASFKIDDWRYRHEEDKIITILFSAELVNGEAQASDDLEVVEWISLARVEELIENGETAPEHRPLFEHIMGKYHS